MRHQGRGPHGPGGGVRRLILSHIGPNLARHPVMEKGIGDVRRIYEGEIVFSEEGMALDLRR